MNLNFAVFSREDRELSRKLEFREGFPFFARERNEFGPGAKVGFGENLASLCFFGGDAGFIDAEPFVRADGALGFNPPDERAVERPGAGGKKHGRDGDPGAAAHRLQATVDAGSIDFDRRRFPEVVVFQEHLHTA